MKVFISMNNKVREDYKNQVFEIITKIDLNNYETIPEFMDVISHPGKMIRSTFTYITSLLEKEQLDLNISYLIVLVELIQAASLIHDDIIDNSLYRRGRETIVNKYGLHRALLLGDCLVFIVMRLIAEMEITQDKRGQILKAISTCLVNMYEGQKFEEILVGNYLVSDRDYINVISNKSSSFFAMACELGAILAGASNSCRKAVMLYGYNIGLAYQMMDDLQSIVCLKKEKTEKSYQTDIERRLVTLPVIIALKECSNNEKEIIKDFYSGKSTNKNSLTKAINNEEVLFKVKERIIHTIIKARDELKDLRDSKYKTALQEYCDYLQEEVNEY